MFVRLTFHVFPGVFTFLLLQNERRRVPTKRLKNRTQQEWLPHDIDADATGKVFDAHGCQVTVIAAKIKPELDCLAIIVNC